MGIKGRYLPKTATFLQFPQTCAWVKVRYMGRRDNGPRQGASTCTEPPLGTYAAWDWGTHSAPSAARVLDSLGATTEPLPHGGQSERVGDKSVPQARLEVLPAAQGRLVALPGRPPLSPSNLTNSTSPWLVFNTFNAHSHPSVGQLSGRLSIPAHSYSLLPAVSRTPLPLAPNSPPRRRQAEVHRDSF